MTVEAIGTTVVLLGATIGLGYGVYAWLRDLKKKPDPTKYESGGLFESGPGYWRVTWVYWFLFCVGVLTTPIIIGIGILIGLFVRSHYSRGDWRNKELQRTIREAAVAKA